MNILSQTSILLEQANSVLTDKFALMTIQSTVIFVCAGTKLLQCIQCRLDVISKLLVIRRLIDAPIFKQRSTSLTVFETFTIYYIVSDKGLTLSDF